MYISIGNFLSHGHSAYVVGTFIVRPLLRQEIHYTLTGVCVVGRLRSKLLISQSREQCGSWLDGFRRSTLIRIHDVSQVISVRAWIYYVLTSSQYTSTLLHIHCLIMLQLFMIFVFSFLCYLQLPSLLLENISVTAEFRILHYRMSGNLCHIDACIHWCDPWWPDKLFLAYVLSLVDLWKLNFLNWVACLAIMGYQYQLNSRETELSDLEIFCILYTLFSFTCYLVPLVHRALTLV